MSPFDTTAYSPFIETMYPSCTIFEIQPVIYVKLQIFPTPLVFGVPLGVTQLEFHSLMSAWR